MDVRKKIDSIPGLREAAKNEIPFDFTATTPHQILPVIIDILNELKIITGQLLIDELKTILPQTDKLCSLRDVIFEALTNEIENKIKLPAPPSDIEKKLYDSFYSNLAKYSKSSIITINKSLVTQIIFINVADVIFKEADKKQKRSNAMNAIAHLGSLYKPELIKRPYLLLKQLGPQVIICKKTSALFKELSHWLSGMYQHSHFLLKQKYKKEKNCDFVDQKETDGGYLPVDEQDETFKKYFCGLTKYEISFFHRDLAVLLQEKINFLLKDEDKITEPMITEKPPVPASEIPSKASGEAIMPIESKPLVDLTYFLASKFFTSCESKINLTEVEIAQFTHLLNYLSETQQDMLKILLQRAYEFCESYVAEGRVMGLWYAAHHSIAVNFKEKMTILSGRLGEQVIACFEFKAKIPSDSKTLLPKMTLFCEGILEILSKESKIFQNMYSFKS